MNVAGDEELVALGQQLDQLLTGVDLKAIKDDEALRAQTAAQFAAIEATLTDLVTEAKVGRRRDALTADDSTPTAA